ncbi:DUF3736 domain-containing protein [Caerostris extrusa]|uniref:DUF3736 domain-containing protein n=1 Tax=Caerostris extrusa TaxID=172846 RepID=A0AAV4XND6_CAEEX|nr:DUF3736 domain-containing protein [Caerostris extrusa]
MENSAQNDRLAEQLRAETNPIKLEFLFKIGLTPITLVKKEEKERIRRIVEEERIRRHYRMLANVNRKSSPRRLFVPKSEAAKTGPPEAAQRNEFHLERSRLQTPERRS